MRRSSGDLWALAVLACVLAFFYWGFLVGRSFIWDDNLTEFYPGVNYFAKSIDAGRFPLWFRGVHDGQPFYSDPQMGVFYPPQWLLIPFVQNGRLPFVAFQRYVVLHYLLGGLFMYAFLKESKLGPIAALSGALVFCLSGFASLRIGASVIIQAYVWLPLQLLCVRRLTCNKSRFAWLGLVGAMAMSLLAGFQQVTVYGWYLVIAYWLLCRYSVCRAAGSGWWPTIREIAGRDALKLVGAFVLVFALSGVSVLPGAENWWRTARPRQSFERLADESLPYHQLLTLVVPNFFGESRDVAPPVPFWGYDPNSVSVATTPVANAPPGLWQYWEFGAYAGQIFCLALVLILFNWQSIEDKLTVGFFLATWVAAIWFMLGRYGGLFQVLYHILPGVSFFRIPVRMSCVATFAAAAVSAYAVDLLRTRARRLRCWPAFLATAVCVCLWLALSFGGKRLGAGLSHLDRRDWSQWETVFALEVGVICALAVVGVVRAQRRWIQVACLWALPVISVVDLYHAYGDFHCGQTSPDEYFPGTNRLLSLLESYHKQVGPFRLGQIIRGRISEELATHRGLAYFHDFLEVPEGYTSCYLSNVARFQNITNDAAKIAIQNIQLTIERVAPKRDWLRPCTNSLPHAKFFARIRRYDSNAALLGALERGEIDWRYEVAVCERAGNDLARGSPQDPVAGANDAVQFASSTPENYSITYNVSQPGIIFISQSFYPGWVADGGRFKMIEVFGAFQGIVIPEAGRGEIRVTFSPPILKLALVISILGVMIAVLVAVLIIRGNPSPVTNSP